jgi:hypothetical protein
LNTTSVFKTHRLGNLRLVLAIFPPDAKPWLPEEYANVLRHSAPLEKILDYGKSDATTMAGRCLKKMQKIK